MQEMKENNEFNFESLLEFGNEQDEYYDNEENAMPLDDNSLLHPSTRCNEEGEMMIMSNLTRNNPWS
jgi:hypothetical protein